MPAAGGAMNHPWIGEELQRMRVQLLRSDGARAPRRARGGQHGDRGRRTNGTAPVFSDVEGTATTMRRMIQITARAREALRASASAASRFDPDARIRLAPDETSGVRADLVHAGQPGD